MALLAEMYIDGYPVCVYTGGDKLMVTVVVVTRTFVVI